MGRKSRNRFYGGYPGDGLHRPVLLPPPPPRQASRASPQGPLYPVPNHSQPLREEESNTPRTIDIMGEGANLTVKGHIDLLVHLPLHHNMHRELLQTFKKKPGSYEGKYNDSDQNKAVVTDLGRGFLSIELTDDITQPELSEFLVGKGWITLAVSYEGNKTFEKWTNVLTERTAPSYTDSRGVQQPNSYY